MIDLLYNFMFGPDFPEVLGFGPAYTVSVKILAQLECMLVALYIFVSIIYFFICLMKKNKRNIL